MSSSAIKQKRRETKGLVFLDSECTHNFDTNSFVHSQQRYLHLVKVSPSDKKNKECTSGTHDFRTQQHVIVERALSQCS